MMPPNVTIRGTTSAKAGGQQTVAAAAPRPQRRNWALAIVGALVVVGCAVIFAAGWLHAGHRLPVLALTHPIAAGQPLRAADVTVVQAGISGPVSLIPASQESGVLGRPAAGALPAGTLLSPADLGAAGPPPGQQDLGVAVKPGQYPPDLTAGQDVDVLATPVAQAGGSAPSQPLSPALPAGVAVVLGVDQDTSAGLTVVELRLSQNAVPQVAAAAAAGQISLATVAAGR